MASLLHQTAIEAKENILNGAVYVIKDAEVGRKVLEMQKRGMDIESADGLDFYRDNVLGDERIREAVKAILPSCGLGIYEVYRASDKNLGTIYSFMTGIEPFNSMVVQLWCPQSKSIYYEDSPKLEVQGYPTPIGLLEIPRAPVKRANCRHLSVTLEEGGILFFGYVKGYALHFVFATEEELRSWPKREFPDDELLRRKAKDIEAESQGILLNFRFGD
jgi:hypothetical protein